MDGSFYVNRVNKNNKNCLLFLAIQESFINDFITVCHYFTLNLYPLIAKKVDPYLLFPSLLWRHLWKALNMSFAHKYLTNVLFSFKVILRILFVIFTFFVLSSIEAVYLYTVTLLSFIFLSLLFKSVCVFFFSQFSQFSYHIQ